MEEKLEEKKELYKHFPSDPKIYKEKIDGKEKKTFLTDRKIDAELYALFLQYSKGRKTKEVLENGKKKGLTIVYKRDLPIQSEICKKIRIKSPKTYRSHLKYLIEREYILDKGEYYILNAYKEQCFVGVSLDTVKFLNDTATEAVWKTYIYLAQRWNWKGRDFIFTLEDLAKHIGKNLNNHTEVYEELNNILQCLQNNELIKIASFYEGKTPKKRLVDLQFHHKTDLDECE